MCCTGAFSGHKNGLYTQDFLSSSICAYMTENFLCVDDVEAMFLVLWRDTMAGSCDATLVTAWHA